MSVADFTRAAKIQGVINRIRTQEAVFQAGHWSSAENFEAQLRADGFTPPVSISHKYNFPDNLPEKECEDMVMWLIYIIYFDPMRIYDPLGYAKMRTGGTPMSPEEKQAYYDNMQKITGELNNTEKEQIVAFFERAQRHAMDDLAKLARNLQKLNPEIADIKIDETSVRDLTDLVIGMTSRFHPDDIKYYMSITDYDTALQKRAKLGEILGYEPRVFIDPKRVDKIVNGITMQRNMQQGRKMQ